MTRSSKHILSFQTQKKTDVLNQILDDFRDLVKAYISLIKSGTLPLRQKLSSKELPDSSKISHSQWKQLAYDQASSIIRSNIKHISKKTFKRYQKLYAKCSKLGRHKSFTTKKYKELNINLLKRIKIDLKNVTVNIDQRLVDCQPGKYFDEFVRIKSPYFENEKRKSIAVKLPLKHHKQSLKFNTWKRKRTIKLSKKNGKMFLTLFYTKDSPALKEEGKALGIDIGYKKLLTTSDKEFYGVKLYDLYQRISRSKQGSKNFKQLLVERDKLINEACNKLPINEVRTLVIENLKNVKHKSAFSKKFNNKLQRWSCIKTISKLERLCEENGVLLIKVDPAYTSQMCHRCGTVKKENRKGETYSCSCGLIADADYNASMNILHRGVYNPSAKKTNNENFAVLACFR